MSYACVGAVEDDDDAVVVVVVEPPGAAAADALDSAATADDAFTAAAPFGVEPWANDSYNPVFGRSDMDVIVVVVVVVVHARCDVAAHRRAVVVVRFCAFNLYP